MNYRYAQRVILVALIAALSMTTGALAQSRRVMFPPAESKPPPPAKAPPKTQASGEDTGIIPDFGPSMRKTQERTPPPPTNLTVMYKVEYGETLEYIHPDGTVQKFEQWKSFANDGYQLMNATNTRLKDGNNYQYATKPLSSPGFDPVDIPLLFMAGDYDFVLSEAEVKNLRKFLTDGGTILFNAARGRDDFNRAVVREMGKVFPGKAFMKTPLDHPLFNARYRLSRMMMVVNGVRFMRPPTVYSMDIGTRSCAILVPDGLGSAWSNGKYHPAGKHIVGESGVRLGVNLVAYVLGSTEYGRYLAQEFPQYDGQTASGDVVRFALARYAGSWNVNPSLQNTMMQILHENTQIDVDFAPHYVSLEDPSMTNYPMVLMTGHYDFKLSREEVVNLADYLRRGGSIIATAAAGLKPFDQAFRREMARVVPDGKLVKLPPSHELFSGGWNPIRNVQYTATALRDDPSLTQPEVFGLFVDERLAVIYSPYDLFSGVNSESNAYAKGLVDEDAARVVVNFITYVLSH